MWLTKMFACERVFEPMSVNFWPHHPTNVAFVWGRERGQLCDGGWGLCLWNVVSWWKGWSWTNAVYLANQTCWSPTDMFTQGLNREIHLSPHVYLFWFECSHFLTLSGFKIVQMHRSIWTFVFPICVPDYLSIFVFLSITFHPPHLSFSLFLFFSFVIGVINGGRGGLAWRPVFQWLIQRCSTAEARAGSNTFCPWTFSPLSPPLCLFP